ncbi:SAM-dependent methyltransferase, partial [Streptomyces sp. GSL17-113]|uniref:SAM-dependent methyltransferase n=1 Tax=Streptomyces sp. GSL17-113 TaxID=3115365 RepID=UPI002E771F16
RIIYVDHDPLVLTHARALLTSSPEGVTHYLDADLREPDTILQGAAETLDFDRPVALMLLGVVAHLTDDSAYDVVSRLM